MIGRLVERGLGAFTSWAVSRGKALGLGADAPHATEADSLRGYVIPDYNTGEPYITRVLLPRLRAFGLSVRPMLHHIHRADHERDLHNHPWAWSFSILLRGSYDEERPVACHHADCSRTTTRRVRWFNFIRGTDLHRITELHGDVWTLFVTGPRVQSWGFREWDTTTESYGITPSKEYIARRKVEKTFTSTDWYEQSYAELPMCSGEYLDRWGSVLNCSRLPSPWQGNEHPEPDADYRERLIKILRGEI